MADQMVKKLEKAIENAIESLADRGAIAVTADEALKYTPGCIKRRSCY